VGLLLVATSPALVAQSKEVWLIQNEPLQDDVGLRVLSQPEQIVVYIDRGATPQDAALPERTIQAWVLRSDGTALPRYRPGQKVMTWGTSSNGWTTWSTIFLFGPADHGDLAAVVVNLDGALFVRPIHAQQSAPAFRGSVDLFTVQVQVLAARGRPLPRLSADQFDLRIAGQRRTVVFAELVRENDGVAPVGPVRSNPRGPGLSADDDFFKPFPNQASALYVLGLEPREADRGKPIRVRVAQRDVSVPRWKWCGDPKRECGTPIASGREP
jgi:hypothetical protein